MIHSSNHEGVDMAHRKYHQTKSSISPDDDRAVLVK